MVKTNKFPQYEQWTNAKFWGFIRSTLRKAWLRWPPRNEAVQEAAIKYRGKDKRRKFSYRCNKCKKTFPRNRVEVDHIENVGSLKDFDDLPGFVRRLFASKNELQVMCRPCHKEKTNDSKANPS